MLLCAFGVYLEVRHLFTRWIPEEDSGRRGLEANFGARHGQKHGSFQ